MDSSRFPILRPIRGLRRRRPHLPIEIISIILSILPVDSIVRFRYVSNLWHELISDPVFIKTQLGRAPLQLMLLKKSRSDNDSGDSFTAHFDLITAADETKRETLAITYSRRGTRTPVIESDFISCDGLLYFYPPVRLGYTDSPAPGTVPFRMPDIITTPNRSAGGSVCNPLLGELIFLPDSQKKSMGYVCGFFFHASSNQYRLLRVTPWLPFIKPPPTYFEYEILALGPEEEGWRSIPCTTSQSPVVRPPVILDNALYWISDSTEDPVIMVFSTDSEDFQSIQLPQGTVPEYVQFSKLVEMDGCLCLFQISNLIQMEMWLLDPKHYRKEGWQKKYTIPMERTGVSWPRPLCYRAICVLCDEIVFYRSYGLLYYNPKLDSFRTVPLCPSFEVCLYRKSLVSLLAINKKSRNHFITSTVSSYGIC